MGLNFMYGMPTHGSLTKAGKVRGQTPKIAARQRISPISRIRNRTNFIKRFEKRRSPGQRKPERSGRR
ncbi:MAG TPA: 30S ribosomal protein S30e [Nitrososphaeraceae archaeon]